MMTEQWYTINPDGTYYQTPGIGTMQPIEERLVAVTEVPPPPIRVSTVFLSLDHRHGWVGEGDGPLVFETMVFGGNHDNWCERYSTIEQARAGHARVVANIAAGRDPSYVDGA
jgi:hypothetical protein